jgi:hypothetical protein
MKIKSILFDKALLIKTMFKNIQNDQDAKYFLPLK